LNPETLKNKGKNASKAIIKTINAATGKESAHDRAFTEANWGLATRSYLSTIRNNLRPGSFAKIVVKARDFAKLSRRGGGTSLGEMADEDDRALLVDVSDDDDGEFRAI